MTGTMIAQPSKEAAAGNKIPVKQQSVTFLISQVMTSLVDSLVLHLQPTHRSDPADFTRLCLQLSRCIDIAVVKNEVPFRANDIPSLLKQICQHKIDYRLQAPLLVLLISIKDACRKGWFSKMDSEELYRFAKEIGSSFGAPADRSSGVSSYSSTIAEVMDRFYPQMKMGEILASLEVKPGYGAFTIDFHVPKDTTMSPREKIWLLVAQKDNTQTAACIVSPPQVNFLVNGRGVERRTNVFMDIGPQLPTNITHMLIYGSNLLQVVGQFNGHYIIIVAYMSMRSSPDTSVLQDYVQPTIADVHSDPDIIEGPSRISLNCPISFKRIKVPVKGSSCNHHQCFDLNNFLDINSRRPSWRCPHCNRSVCYLDIRIDQNMVKVLRGLGESISSKGSRETILETDDNVMEVIIASNGSWRAVLESDDNVGQAWNNTLIHQNQRPEQQEESSILPNAHPPNVIDLTKGNDYMMDPVGGAEVEEDQKLTNLIMPLETNPSSLEQNLIAQAENGFRSTSSVRAGVPTSPLPQRPEFPWQFSQAITPMNTQSTPVNNISIPNPRSATMIPAQSLASTHQQIINPSGPNIPSIPQRPPIIPTGQSNNQAASSSLPSPHASSRPPPPPGFLSQFQNSHLQQTLNPRFPHSMGQYSRTVQHQPLLATAQRDAEKYGRPSLLQGQNQTTPTGNSTQVGINGLRTSVGEQSGNKSNGPGDSPLEQSWRPTGRMRGSLSGQAYADALNKLLNQPNRVSNPTRPLNSTSTRPTALFPPCDN